MELVSSCIYILYCWTLPSVFSLLCLYSTLARLCRCYCICGVGRSGKTLLILLRFYKKPDIQYIRRSFYLWWLLGISRIYNLVFLIFYFTYPPPALEYKYEKKNESICVHIPWQIHKRTSVRIHMVFHQYQPLIFQMLYNRR